LLQKLLKSYRKDPGKRVDIDYISFSYMIK
jgi:hypothetical protein